MAAIEVLAVCHREIFASVISKLFLNNSHGEKGTPYTSATVVNYFDVMYLSFPTRSYEIPKTVRSHFQTCAPTLMVRMSLILYGVAFSII